MLLAQFSVPQATITFQGAQKSLTEKYNSVTCCTTRGKQQIHYYSKDRLCGIHVHKGDNALPGCHPRWACLRLETRGAGPSNNEAFMQSVTTAGSPSESSSFPCQCPYPSNTDPQVFRKHVLPERHDKLQTNSRYSLSTWLRSEWVSWSDPCPSIHSTTDKYYRHW
jgi:hypothetical protein